MPVLQKVHFFHQERTSINLSEGILPNCHTLFFGVIFDKRRT